MSDHLPLCVHIDLPVNCLQFIEVKHILPKPKWYCADSDTMQRYRKRLDMYLNHITIPDHFEPKHGVDEGHFKTWRDYTSTQHLRHCCVSICTNITRLLSSYLFLY